MRTANQRYLRPPAGGRPWAVRAAPREQCSVGTQELEPEPERPQRPRPGAGKDAPAGGGRRAGEEAAGQSGSAFCSAAAAPAGDPGAGVVFIIERLSVVLYLGWEWE